MHGIGLTETLAGLPEWVTFLFAIITQFGDAWFLFGGVALCYWYADKRFDAVPQRSGGVLIALGICGLATTVALKSLFAVHRPVGAGEAFPPGWLPAALDALYRSISTADGFGFPSGHAVGSTVVYGGAALLYDRLAERRTRLLVAAVAIGLISLSRLVIGVHLLPDVLAGILVGAVVLFGTLRLADGRPEVAFLVATGISGVALVFALAGGHSGEASKAAISIGAGLGGVAEWHRHGDAERVRVPARWVALGLPVLGGFWGVVYAADLALPLAALGSAIAVGGIVAMPRLVVWWHERATAKDTVARA
jgi:membrane-associated phospholipid phosphatase